MVILFQVVVCSGSGLAAQPLFTRSGYEGWTISISVTKWIREAHVSPDSRSVNTYFYMPLLFYIETRPRVYSSFIGFSF